MANTIYDNTRALIGDSTAPYTISDSLLLSYMDIAIDKASEIVGRIITEDVTISASDITNGYKDLSYEISAIIDTDLGYEFNGVYWQVDGGKRIRFIDADSITAGTYSFTYKSRFTKNLGTKKTDTELNIPAEFNLPITYLTVFYSAQEAGLIQADGTLDLISNKSEEGMSVSYGGLGGLAKVGTPDELFNLAIKMLQNSPASDNIMLSVQI